MTTEKNKLKKLDAAEFDLVKDIREILGCFREAITYLQGQKYPTLNKAAKFITDIWKT